MFYWVFTCGSATLFIIFFRQRRTNVFYYCCRTVKGFLFFLLCSTVQFLGLLNRFYLFLRVFFDWNSHLFFHFFDRLNTSFLSRLFGFITPKASCFFLGYFDKLNTGFSPLCGGAFSFFCTAPQEVFFGFLKGFYLFLFFVNFFLNF